MRLRLLAGVCLLLGCAASRPVESTAAPSADAGVSTLVTLQHEARNLTDWVKSPLAKDFLAQAAELPPISRRTAYLNADKTIGYSQAQADALPEAERKALIRKELDEEYYYTSRYGTPNSYARALDVLAEHGFESLAGKRVLDFGYGYIGHLRMFALLGAEATGVEVDPLLPVLYGEPGDTGEITSRAGRKGSVRLVNGRFPFDPVVKASVGQGYDLFLSKNVLKIGFVHPSHPVEPKRMLGLGVDDETYARAVWDLLKPGGRVLIYNLYPSQNPPDKEWIAWAEGKTAFSRETFERVGFRVVEFDLDDTHQVREMAHRLGWDADPEEPMDLKTLFAIYTLLEKPAAK
jgi:SAM-dependent methyltransferase